MMSQRGGSGNKKMKKFPRVIDYLEAHHKDIYDLFDDLAMHSALTPRRGGSITFLLPDKSMVSKIRDAIESDKPEDATDMLSSLVLTDLFESVDDFKEKQDDVPTLLGKRLVIKSTTGSKVVLDNGAELTVDSKFKPFERQGTARRGNLAVWLLKGKVDYENAPETTNKYAKTPMKPKKGGCDSDKLKKKMVKIIKKEIESYREDKAKTNHPMLSAVTRVLTGLELSKENHELEKAKFVLTKHPSIDFFLLFHTPDVFDQDKVYKAYKTGSSANAVEVIKRIINPNTDLSKLDELRTKLITSMSVRAPGKIIEAYNNWDQTNLPVAMPESLHKIYKAKKGLHLALDEFKYYVYKSVEYVKEKYNNNPAAKANEYENIYKSILLCYKKLGNPGVSVITNPLMDKASVDNIKDFVSTFGFHLASGVEDKGLTDRVDGGCEDCDENDLIDVDFDIDQDLSNFECADFALSDKAIAELKTYVKLNGRMPDL